MIRVLVLQSVDSGLFLNRVIPMDTKIVFTDLLVVAQQ